MDSIFKAQWSGEHGHPSEDVLLLFVDGELSAKEATSLRIHMEACWSCRVRTEKIEEAISTFIDYRNNLLKPLVESPPQDWRRFDGKLSGLAGEVGKPSLFANVRGTLGRIFSAPNLSLNIGVFLRPAAAALVLATVVAGLIYFNRTSVVSVSASELLERADDAQHHAIAATNQAVVYQKLQLRRKTVASSTSESLTWEVWTDTVNLRTHQLVTDAAGGHFVNIETNDSNIDRKGPGTSTSAATRSNSPMSLTELSKVMLANHMNPAMPLSAASYEAWRRSVSPKHEEVTRTSTADGHQALLLRTAAVGQLSPGAVIEASLLVRESDWHPLEERLRVKGEEGDDEFELIEARYSVVSLSALSPNIFNEQPLAAASPVNRTTPEAKAAESTLITVPQPLTPSTATTDLEVEILKLLNEAGADLGEQISVTKSMDGLLQVAGIVETAERKSEIMRALQPVTKNPAVRIEIQTVVEAVAQQQQQRNRAKATPSSVTEQRVEINNDSIPVAAELRRHFSSDNQVRQFAARIVSQSRSAMRHVFAMKRLFAQFSPQERQALTPAARNNWLALIHSHARAYQSEAEGLRRELQPIFFPSDGDAMAPGSEITEETSLGRAINQLFSVASANDAVIRSAFATSSEASAAPAIGSAHFWQSLKSAEAIAASVLRTR